MPKSEMWNKLLKVSVGSCPKCGFSLDLYSRPINVRYLLCCNCEAGFSEEYFDGFVAGMQKIAPTQALVGRGYECPKCHTGLARAGSYCLQCGQNATPRR